jgi:hypothetical protein
VNPFDRDLVEDGFAEIFQASDEELFQPRSLAARVNPRWQYLTRADALEALQRDPIPDTYRIGEGRGALSLQREPNLVEVRRRNAERLELWKRQRRELCKRLRESS